MPTICWQCSLQVLQDLRNRTRTLHCQDLVALLRAHSQDPLEHVLLSVKAPIEPRAGVEPYFAHVPGIWEQALEQANLCRSLGDKLRMKSQRDPHEYRIGG